MSKYLPKPTAGGIAGIAFTVGAAISVSDGGGHLGIVFALIGIASILAEAADTLSDIRRDAREHHERMYRRFMEMYANVEDVDRIMQERERQ